MVEVWVRSKQREQDWRVELPGIPRVGEQINHPHDTGRAEVEQVIYEPPVGHDDADWRAIVVIR